MSLDNPIIGAGALAATGGRIGRTRLIGIGVVAVIQAAALGVMWWTESGWFAPVLFVLDDHGAKRDAYRAQLPDLTDRLVFVDVPETDPDAAIMVVNNPVADGQRIRDLVTAGFIVRTRADAETVQSRLNYDKFKPYIIKQ